MPKPPSDRAKIERSIIAAKLLIVQRATKLGVHQEPQFKSDGRSVQYTHTADVPNLWAAVYGRIVRTPNLNEDLRHNRLRRRQRAPGDNRRAV